MVHQIHAGTIFHISSFLPAFPSLFQLFSTSLILPGFTHLIFLLCKNICHSWSVHLQCKKRWLTVSICSSHR
uniref:Putative ovule protein n=1 Tax=Solanum chacoense TaxID=4108 RepID=A0A0V0H1A1_SOLCH